MANKQYVVPIEISPSTGGGGGSGTVTSVGTGGIATGGPITTSGTVTVAGSGNTTTAATADSNVHTAPSGDVITADGSGNVQDSGTLLSSLAPSSAAGGTVLGNNTTTTGTAAYTTAPVLGIPGTSTGTIALASATAGGKFTISAPFSSATPTLNLPTTTGVLVDAGDGTLIAATVGQSGALSLVNAPGGSVFGNASNNGLSAPSYTTAPVLGIPGSSTGTITLTSISGTSGKYTITAPAANLTTTLTLPTTSNVLAGQFVGDGTLLSSATQTASSAGTLTAVIANAGAGTVLNNGGTVAAAPTYTINPVIGVPGISTGTIALASSLTSGKYTITAPSNSSTPTLTLPTTSNVLAGQFAGDNVIFTSTLQTASAAGTLTPSLLTQTANTVLAGPTSAGPSTPTFRALVAADIPSGTVVWNNIGNATGALTLANAGNATTFNQTSGVAWLWANTTTGTNASVNASPLLELAANYYTGATSGQDLWTLGSSLAAGTNGVSKLTLSHTGSTGATYFSLASSGVTGLQYQATPGAIDFGANATWTLNFTNNNGGTTNGSITGQAAIFVVSTPQNLILKSTGAAKYVNLYGDITTSSGTSIIMENSGNFTGAGSTVQVGVGIGSTAGQGSGLKFAPTAGSGTFLACAITPVINQTGSASGNYYGLVVGATETALLGSNNKLLSLQAGTGGSTVAFEISGNSNGNTISAGVITNYNGIATTGNGVPAEYAALNSTSNSAAKPTTALYTTPASVIAVALLYRLSYYLVQTTAATSSAAIQLTIGWTDVSLTAQTATSTSIIANLVGAETSGTIVLQSNVSSAINYSVSYTSVGITAAAYAVYLRLEAL